MNEKAKKPRKSDAGTDAPVPKSEPIIVNHIAPNIPVQTDVPAHDECTIFLQVTRL